MRTRLMGGVCAAAVAGILVAVPGPAHAAGCVTKAEFNTVKKGWPQGKVHAKFGTSGKRLSIATSGGYAAEVRTYTGCGGPYNVVSVAYDRDPGDVFRLGAKSAVWVS
jgi:hypothetical protein